ncbi:hypothetical protein BKA80DRAFT_84505 [Phyllosticta citrichinensis]
MGERDRSGSYGAMNYSMSMVSEHFFFYIGGEQPERTSGRADERTTSFSIRFPCSYLPSQRRRRRRLDRVPTFGEGRPHCVSRSGSPVVTRGPHKKDMDMDQAGHPLGSNFWPTSQLPIRDSCPPWPGGRKRRGREKNQRGSEKRRQRDPVIIHGPSSQCNSSQPASQPAGDRPVKLRLRVKGERSSSPRVPPPPPCDAELRV